MNKEFEWKLRYMRLQGEFTGFLSGLAFWDLPDDLMDKIISFAEELEERHNKIMEIEERADNTEDITI